MSDIAITVFTPTFNRAYTLDNLYQSLKRQTCMNFEWLVIDDGSTDNTKLLFDEWLKINNSFPIRYIKVENGGKHRAINKGVPLAKGKLFFIVDSDDFLTEDAIGKIQQWENELPKDSNAFSGVAGAKGYSVKQMIGSGSAVTYVDASSQDRKKFGITGDKAEAYYTDVLKQFPFPTFEGENFLTESVVWFAIGEAGYKIRWYNDIIYIAEYLQDGLSNNDNLIFEKNPYGLLALLKSDLKHLKLPLIRRLACYATYYQVAKNIGLTNKEIENDLNISKFKIYIAVLLKKIKKAIIK